MILQGNILKEPHFLPKTTLRFKGKKESKALGHTSQKVKMELVQDFHCFEKTILIEKRINNVTNHNLNIKLPMLNKYGEFIYDICTFQ